MIDKCNRCKRNCKDASLEMRILCESFDLNGRKSDSKIPKYANRGVSMAHWNVNMAVR